MPRHSLVPVDIDERYEVHEWRNALAILSGAHAEAWRDVLTVLREFQLRRSEILAKGGAKSPIVKQLDARFYSLGWVEKAFDAKIQVDDNVYEAPTHKVDCFKDRVAIEVEWNNKDTFFDRDLNNYRLLFELRAIDVGVVVTRCDELQEIFNSLGKGSSFGASTTHMSRLLPRLNGGGGGDCPVAVFGIRGVSYVED